MAKKEKPQKVYMPLMMGDWIKGTRGMRAEVKGVYIGLLIHQYDHGYIPDDVDDLALIEPEVNKVWVKLKDKFKQIAPGKLQNEKLEEVRDFWTKQKNNGKKGGRPKNNNPNNNPEANPNPNPNNNLNNDIDLDNDFVLNYKKESSNETFESTLIALDESLSEVEQWTNEVIEGNDVYFINMCRHTNTSPGDLERLARDHLGLVARYNWQDKMTTQQAFRLSLIGHITKELNNHKQPKGISKNKLDEFKSL